MEINNLVDLNSLRTAPNLSNSQVKKLLEEIEANIFNADWITIGIMATCDTKAIEALSDPDVRNIHDIRFGIANISIYSQGG